MNNYAIRATTGPLSRYNQATAPTILDAHELAIAFSKADQAGQVVVPESEIPG